MVSPKSIKLIRAMLIIREKRRLFKRIIFQLFAKYALCFLKSILDAGKFVIKPCPSFAIKKASSNKFLTNSIVGRVKPV